MPLDQPPIPTSRHEEFPVRSQIYPELTYILKPYGHANVASTLVNQRLIAAKRRPITMRMREILLGDELKAHFSPADISRIYETIQALQANAMGIPEEDVLFIDQTVDPIAIEHIPEYRQLVLEDEKLAYERRMRDLADVLYAVEEKGERYTFPSSDSEARFDYVRHHIDPLDISMLYVQSRNLSRVSPEMEKNSDAPSMSG